MNCLTPSVTAMRESGYNALSRQEAADLLYALDDEDA